MYLLFAWLSLFSCNWIGSDVDGDGIPVGEDCDDRDAGVLGATDWFDDLDADGYGSGEPISACEAPPFTAADDADCDDRDAAVNPGADDVCNGIDDDCDGTVDPGCDGTGDTGLPDDTSDTGGTDALTGDTGAPPLVTCFPDLDADGYGVAGASVEVPGGCPSGYSATAGDCNDVDPLVNPSAVDAPADYVDSDCDGVDACYVDGDGDGFGTGTIEPGVSLSCSVGGGHSLRADDCDDLDPAVHPGAAEICDGKDTDCQFGPGPGEVDDDGDGVFLCAFDCDDFDPLRYPENPENCLDGIDRDCDGNPGTATYYVDDDGDGVGGIVPVVTDCTAVPSNVVAARGDCDDSDPDVNPDAIEIVGDDLDNDCDGTLSCFDDRDNDGVGSTSVITSASCTIDGAAPVTGDCNDTNPGISPLAGEVLDPQGLDENCDGLRACWSDADFDGFGAAPVVEVAFCVIDDDDDCGPLDPAVNPAALEACNGIDDDCDGEIPLIELDGDGDGAVDCPWVGPAGIVGDDCNDTDPTVLPGAPEQPGDGIDQDCDGVDHCYTDLDDDGVGTAGMPPLPGDSLACDTDPGWASIAGDCDDADRRAFPGNAEICDGVDNDCSGTLAQNESDADGDGTPTCAGDCDDNDASRSPANAEVCGNNVDENCDGLLDGGSWYVDVDGDGYGDPNQELPADCNPPSGAVARAGDCDDADPLRNPAAIDVPADGIDQNCDGLFACYADADGDGVGASTVVNVPTCAITVASDCDDSNAARFPGNTEVCDGLDNDCMGGVPLNEVDGDGDGFVLCSGWTGAPSLSGNDCDDGRAQVYPGAPERCNGRDDDCNGVVPAGELDSDADGYVACSGWSGVSAIESGDCDDADPTRHVGAVEVCDGVDNDCAQGVPANEVDNDADGFVECGPWVGVAALGAGDCDDAAADVSPQGTEIAGDGVDQDCSGGDTCFVDADDDGYGTGSPVASTTSDCASVLGLAAVGGDCDDTRVSVSPAATEICDGLDNDCDQVTPPAEADGDGDGVRQCGGDCDDTDPTAYPGAAEICNNDIDEDCDGNAQGASWYTDLDGDGYGDPSTLQTGCTVPSGFVTVGGDCDDTRNFVYPGATEVVGTAFDEDCSGTLSCYQDSDGDGFGTTTVVQASSCTTGGAAAFTGDCDDNAAQTYPRAPELCDGRNNDCANGVPGTEIDNDGDGAVECGPFVGGALLVGGDCDDTDPSVYAGATEACDGVDNDCDGVVPGNEHDVDGDLFVTCVGWSGAGGISGGDCNDGAATAYPGAPEICDGLDNDCAGGVPANEIDSDQDGYVACTGWSGTPSLASGDCAGSDPNRNPGEPEIVGDAIDQDCDSVDACYTDQDNDGFGTDPIVDGLSLFCDEDPFRASLGGDCHDGSAEVNPDMPEACDGIDTNCTPGDEVDEVDADGDGVLLCAGDCDDDDPARYPGNVEDCTNQIDEDCDGQAQGGTFYVDADGDGFGAGPAVLDCTAPAGHVTQANDCNDNSNLVFPGATEVVGNNVDENCDDFFACYADGDDDGYGSSTVVQSAVSCANGTNVATVAGDCDNGNPSVYPQQADTVCDGLDTACLGSVPVTEVDNDGDGYVECDGWTGFSIVIFGGNDCDDANAGRFPTNPEICDGVDNDCNGVVPNTEIDNDGDDYVECEGWSGGGGLASGDCNDESATTHPGATELCDGIDNDCSGTVPAGETDDDGDGRVECTGWIGDSPPASGDCNDANASIYSGAPETAGDGIDQDCDGSDTCYVDGDGDGFGSTTTVAGTGLDCDTQTARSSVSTDCDDAEPLAYPDNPEVCDGIDNDCDLVVDDLTLSWYPDADGDGFGDATAPASEADCNGLSGSVLDNTDCDDASSITFPGAGEVCDGVDNDCDPNSADSAGVFDAALVQRYATLDEALNAASGDRNLYVCGSVTGGTVAGRNVWLFEKDGNGGAPARLTEGPAGSALVVSDGGFASVSGIDLGGAAAAQGANLLVTVTASAELANLEIAFGSATGEGGGAYVAGALDVNNVEVHSNVAASGGGIYCADCLLTGSSLTVRDNEAGNGRGGGLAIVGSGYVDVEDLVVTGNRGLEGGGASVESGTLSSTVNYVFDDNESFGDGGALWVASGGVVDLLGGSGTWNRNTAPGAAAVAVYTGEVRMEGVTIEAHTSGSMVLYSENAAFNFVDGVIAGNTGTQSDGLVCAGGTCILQRVSLTSPNPVPPTGNLIRVNGSGRVALVASTVTGTSDMGWREDVGSSICWNNPGSRTWWSTDPVSTDLWEPNLVGYDLGGFEPGQCAGPAGNCAATANPCP